jgi:hypothetical protein
VKTYPARFVGEVAYGDVYAANPPSEIGDVFRVPRFEDANNPDWSHGPYLGVHCACGARHLAALAPYAFSNGASWTLSSESPVHFDPSVVTDVGSEPHCHFFVHNGELQMLDDTTSPLK